MRDEHSFLRPLLKLFLFICRCACLEQRSSDSLDPLHWSQGIRKQSRRERCARCPSGLRRNLRLQRTGPLVTDPYAEHTGIAQTPGLRWGAARAVLEREFNNLLVMGTDRRFDEDDDKSFRRAPSWRKKFRPKDVRGLAAGSAETLPANFRVPSSLSSPSVQPKKMQLDGR
eukprot:bmy_14356T0